MKIISFDFDDTLCMSNGFPNFPMINKVKKYETNGFECVIVTARNEENEVEQPDRILIKDFLKCYNIPIKKLYFTNHKPKGPFLKKIKAIKHYDDDEAQINSAKDHGIKAIKSKSIFDIKYPEKNGKSKNSKR